MSYVSHQMDSQGSIVLIECAHCHRVLDDERAVASTLAGPRFFCKMIPGDKLEDSCYRQWRMRHC